MAGSTKKPTVPLGWSIHVQGATACDERVKVRFPMCVIMISGSGRFTAARDVGVNCQVIFCQRNSKEDRIRCYEQIAHL